MITPLPFDSALFGYSVGKCTVAEDWDETFFLKQAMDYRLVYIFSKKSIQTLSSGFLPADIKLTFEKNLSLPNRKESEIRAYLGAMTEELMSLALESGIFSRFKTDPGFRNGEYEKLYRLWIKSALERQEVLVAGDFAGFVTCQNSDNGSSIGLIAVDRSQRGFGWGKRLVKAAENVAIKNGALSLKIGTQEANVTAVALYQGLGYQLIERTYVYHWWNRQ